MAMLTKSLVLLLPFASFLLGLPLPATLVTFAIGFLVWNVLDNVKSGYKLPPGPRKWPLVGNLPAILYYGFDEYLDELVKRYDKIFNFDLLGKPYVHITDYEMAKEFSLHPDFQGRPRVGALRLMMKEFGILDSEGSLWKHQRRFMLHSLRDSGMGKMQIEEKISDQMDIVCEEIRRSNGTPIHLEKLLQKAACNVMFGMAFNKTFDFEDPVFTNRIEKLNETIVLMVKLVLTSEHEKLYKFSKKAIKALQDNVAIFHRQSDDFIADHKSTIDEDNPRDFLDLYLIEMSKEATGENSEFVKTFSKQQLKTIIIDLFLAGTETTSTTIRWAILYMLHNPDIQKKVQMELDEVIGQNRGPNFSDKLNLPYTVATLQEIERMSSVVPWGLPRSNSSPAKFREYSFPANCVFYLNIDAMHRDPKQWDEPEEFRPERFINSEGKAFRPPSLVPFGNGKRSCAGEALARIEIFLFFATLLQKFTFNAPDGKLPDLTPFNGGTRFPKQYKIVAKPRF